MEKGTHKAVDRLEQFVRKTSKNYSQPCFVLKCDIKRFFDSVDQRILFELIKKKINNKDVLCLIWQIISSFRTIKTLRGGLNRKGIPLGNLTSQLFANIYLNELDQFVKHQLKIKYYLRYCDDFVIVADNTDYLKSLIPRIKTFLSQGLDLKLHPNKIIIRKLRQGIDFLGYVVLPHYRVLRTRTIRRMLTRVNQKNFPSYLGLLKHCKGYKLGERIKKLSNLEVI